MNVRRERLIGLKLAAAPLPLLLARFATSLSLLPWPALWALLPPPRPAGPAVAAGGPVALMLALWGQFAGAHSVCVGGRRGEGA